MAFAPSKPVVLFMFVVFFHHLYYHCQRNDEGCIHAGGNVNGVTITEDGELSTDSC